MAEILAQWGIDPMVAASGKEAMALFRSAQRSGKRFGLLVSDIHLPDLDGFTLVELLGREADLRQTIVVLLSAAGQRGDLARCGELGIAACLTKPVVQSQLLDAILNAVGAEAAAAEPSVPAVRQNHSCGARTARSCLPRTTPVNQKLTSRLLERRGHTVVVVPNGRLALEQLEREPFDMVLMDVSMPEMDEFSNRRGNPAAGKRGRPTISLSSP